MSRERILFATIMALLAFNFSHSTASETSWAGESVVTPAVLKSVGFTGLALAGECTATRNPILESICACLGDLPGSYCYHESCAVVGVSIPVQMGNQTDRIKVIH